MKKRLGRGLESILQETENSYYSGTNEDSVVEIDAKKIKSNPYQPRKVFDKEKIEELSNSIKENGLISPILVYKEQDDYILIAGERRVKATVLAGIAKIRAIVVDDTTKEKIAKLAIIENVQRENLNPIELALSYKTLIEDLKLKQEELSEQVHQSRSAISNTMRLLKLSKKVQNMILENKLAAGAAKNLVGLDSATQELIAVRIVEENLSVRDVEKMVVSVKMTGKTSKKVTKNTKKIDFDKRLKEKLKSNLLSLNMDSKITNDTLVIKLNGDENLRFLIEKLK